MRPGSSITAGPSAEASSERGLRRVPGCSCRGKLGFQLGDPGLGDLGLLERMSLLHFERLTSRSRPSSVTFVFERVRVSRSFKAATWVRPSSVIAVALRPESLQSWEIREPGQAGVIDRRLDQVEQLEPGQRGERSRGRRPSSARSRKSVRPFQALQVSQPGRGDRAVLGPGAASGSRGPPMGQAVIGDAGTRQRLSLFERAQAGQMGEPGGVDHRVLSRTRRASCVMPARWARPGPRIPGFLRSSSSLQSRQSLSGGPARHPSWA